MHFFCSGDMLNRFSKDIGTVEEYLPYIIFDCLQVNIKYVMYNIV